jgi:hypothetical protein
MLIKHRGASSAAAASFILALGLLVLPLTALPSRADDVGTDLSNAGQSIKKAAQDTGTAIGNGAKDAGNAIESKGQSAVDATKEGAQKAGDKVQEGAETAGAKVKEGAQATGNFFERTAVKVRDETGAFFKRVGDYFAGP